MYDWWLGLGGVVLLGLQTSISPCPLTTNITAMSYIARKISNSRDVMFSGLLYTLGQTLTYISLTMLVLTAMLFSGETMTRVLQTQMHGCLGPVLLVIGMMMLGLLPFRLGGVQGDKMRRFADSLGMWSALPLGAIFALTFCPTSAATFLATITLASQYRSNVIFPMAFGIGTAAPVLIFAMIIALNARLLGQAFSAINILGYWMRTITGTLFIAIGIWFSLRYVYAVI
jgi:cytochrome c biogenesis protein CcdA